MRIRSAASFFIATALALVVWTAPAPRAEDSPILAAMRDEMKRSMDELQLKGEPRPYYIEYQVDESSVMRTVARLGGVVDDLASRGRVMRVEVRVGDYAFDSSRFLTQERGGGLVAADGAMTAPLDDNYDAMRREMWLLTDAAYKRALSVFAKKKAAFQNRPVAEQLPDFSREKPVEILVPPLLPRPDTRDWVERVQKLSAIFLSKPDLDLSEVGLSEVRGTSYFLNSEGFKSAAPVQLAFFRATAETQAADGTPVRDLVSLVENRIEDLPSPVALTSRVQDLANRAVALRTAPVGEEFTGPVLLEGQASAELLRQTLAPLLLARRAADAENPRFAQGVQVTPFLSRVGLRVLSDAFSVSDTPSLTQYEGRPVPGAYLVDDEGMPAKDVKLVEGGRLVTLLTGRTPQKNLLQSNGHGRTGTVQPGVLQVRSAQGVPARELKMKLLELLKAQDKPFGYIVRGIAGPGDVPGAGPGGPVILQAVKVTTDGVETPVRGLRFGVVPPTAFRDILEASEERTLHSYRLNAATAASVIAPDLIFEELEIQKTKDILQKAPIVPSPLP